MTIPPWLRPAWEIVSATIEDGFVYAGNLAYMALITLFPTGVMLASIAGTFGRTEAGQQLLDDLLATLPPETAATLAPALDEVIEARSGPILTLSFLVALWAVSSFIETLRDVLRRSYGAKRFRPMWYTRLTSGAIAVVMASSVLFAFVFQILFTLFQTLVAPFLGIIGELPGWFDLSRIVPALVLFLALWALFAVLAPHGFHRLPTWPGALITAFAWVVAAWLLGPVLGSLGMFARAYGALSGVMVALIFFFVVGLSLVLGAQTNAWLARRRLGLPTEPDMKVQEKA